jgi:uncharacterized protein YqiB (DUF1249 family)
VVEERVSGGACALAGATGGSGSALPISTLSLQAFTSSFPGDAMQVEKRGSIRSLMPVYEDNYRLISRLVPAVGRTHVPTTFILSAYPRISLSILECARYTSLATLTHSFGVCDGRLLKDMEMRLRIYHDARLLEVLSYQGRGRFAPAYDYPNEDMLSPFEKRQVNVFLGEWLRACRYRRVPLALDS